MSELTPDPSRDVTPDVTPDRVSSRPAPPLDGNLGTRPSQAQLVQLNTVATVVFVVAAALSAAAPNWFVVLGVGVSVTLFVTGTLAYLVAYARAVGRSRLEELDLPGVFFGVDSLPRPLQRRLLILLAIQVVVGLAAAASRPFTPLAFCTLSPVFGLGMLGLCGATHGRFPPRTRRTV